MPGLPELTTDKLCRLPLAFQSMLLRSMSKCYSVPFPSTNLERHRASFCDRCWHGMRHRRSSCCRSTSRVSHHPCSTLDHGAPPLRGMWKITTSTPSTARHVPPHLLCCRGWIRATSSLRNNAQRGMVANDMSREHVGLVCGPPA